MFCPISNPFSDVWVDLYHVPFHTGWGFFEHTENLGLFQSFTTFTRTKNISGPQAWETDFNLNRVALKLKGLSLALSTNFWLCVIAQITRCHIVWKRTHFFSYCYVQNKWYPLIFRKMMPPGLPCHQLQKKGISVGETQCRSRMFCYCWLCLRCHLWEDFFCLFTLGRNGCWWAISGVTEVLWL